MPQFYAFDTCPQCGIIVWKFLEKRAIGERSLDKPPGRTTTVEKEPHPKPAEEEAVVRTRTGQSAAQPPPPVQGAPLPQPSEKQQTTGAPPSEATGQAQGTLYRRDTPEPSDERPRAGPYSEPPTGQALPLVEGKDPSKPSVRELATQEPGRETRYRGPSHEQRQELIEWIGWTIWADMEKLGKLQSALAFLHFLAGFARRNIGWIVAIALVIVSASVSLYLLKAPLDAIQGQVSYGSVDRELYPGGSEEPLVRVWGRAGTGASGSPQEGTGR
ncbi:MAG: hypothetical protein FJY85_16415 [Deltaproteobacteria bacterium]|nr:hypothetical protein [Deltaproteobacteria bacterium]